MFQSSTEMRLQLVLLWIDQYFFQLSSESEINLLFSPTLKDITCTLIKQRQSHCHTVEVAFFCNK